MADIATDVALRLTYKYLTTSWGTKGSADSAQVLRRVASNFNLRKSTLQSAEKRTDYQVSDYRHGPGMVAGRISGELSPLTYKDFFQAICRQAFQAAATTGAIDTVTAAASAPQFVDSGDGFLTAGFKVGDVIRWTGFSETANNNRNFLITALTAGNMSGIFLDGSAVKADAAGDTVTGTVVGKKTWVPVSGHIDPHFDIEHWHADISQSEVYYSCKLNSMQIGLDPSRLVSIDMDFMGKDQDVASSAYHTTPADETETGLLSPATGFVYVGGTQIALLTGLQLSIMGNMAPADRVVGAQRPPAILEGPVVVTGSFGAYFQDATLRDYFRDEAEVSIYGVFAESADADAGFVSFVMPRCKVGAADKDDGARGYIQTFPFVALLNVSGGSGTATEETTISIQDSGVS